MFDEINAWRAEWVSNWMLLGLTLILVYNYITWNFGVLKNLGIKGPRPLPFLGNLVGLQNTGVLKYDLELKKKYGTFAGFFFGKTPCIVVYDTQILKQIMIKESHNFTNRIETGLFSPPFDKMVSLLKDDHWRRVRSVLTPTFSSGKMRKMSSQLNRCCNTLCTNLSSFADTGEIVDFRQLCGAYTMDVIASTAFGIEIDSQNDPKNEFVINATKLFKFKLNAAMLLLMISPPLYKFFEKFGLSVFDRDAASFFVNFIDKITKERLEGFTQYKQIDFLQIMVAAHQDGGDGKSESNKDDENDRIDKRLTYDEVLAQGCLFLLAGFDTTANTLSLFIYNMSLYPETQERLYNEIIDKFSDEEESSYDTVKDLVYLEMCFSETLRMFPAGPRSDRVASADITIDNLFIPKGMTIIVPICALQNDPTYWEKPDVFDPERFAPEVRSKIDPLRYIPFGVGPRNCVGMRFAILELKMAIVQIMRKFKFLTGSETEVPVTFDPMSIRAKNGINILVEKRQ